MRRIIAALAIVLSGALTLGACGGTDSAKKALLDAPSSTGIAWDTSHNQWVRGGEYNCDDTTEPIEVAMGTHTETSPKATYSLSENIVKVPIDDISQDDHQDSVRLQVSVPAGYEIPSAIVRTAGSRDQPLYLHLMPGGTLNMKLLSAQYAADNSNAYNGYPISSVVLCARPTR